MWLSIYGMATLKSSARYKLFHHFLLRVLFFPLLGEKKCLKETWASENSKCSQWLYESKHASEYYQIYRGGPVELHRAMWWQLKGLSWNHATDFHSVLPAALNPGITAQQHCSLGSLQAPLVHSCTARHIYKDTVGCSTNCSRCCSIGRRPSLWSLWSVWPRQIWSTSSLCPSGSIMASHTPGLLETPSAWSVSTWNT